MAAGDPQFINLPGCTFLLEEEDGVIIQSSDRSIDSKLKEIFNAAVGATTGYVFYDFKATQDFNAIVNGTDGLSAAAPGVALVLANDLGIGTAKNGVSAGGLYTTSAKVSHQGEDLRMISGSTIQRQLIA
jgi:hypothetical protein